MAQARIFVSHSHEDNAWCRSFVAALRERGADVWYDEHDLGYVRLMPEIERELRDRPVFVVVLSPAAVASPWVQREVNAAIQLHDREPERDIVPVLAAACEVPLFWSEYRRASGEHDAPLTPAHAADEVLGAVGGRGDASAVAERVYLAGVEQFKAGRFRDALASFERAIALNPRHLKAWNAKGSALYSLKRFEEAHVAYDRAVVVAPDYATAWAGLAATLYYLGRHGEALAANDRSLVLVADQASTWVDRGDILLLGLGRYGEAAAAYERALAIDPSHADAQEKLATAHRAVATWGPVARRSPPSR